jgi:hypothetical protein
MTSEEMERAIEFLLQSQANFEAQIAETNRIVQMQAESQSQLNEMLTKAITDLAEAQRRTEGKVDRLIDVAAHSNTRHDETDARLDRLSVVVERLVEERNGNG